MPIVDVHAHIYPEKIAERAVDNVGEFYQVQMVEVEGGDTCARGSASHYLALMQTSGITHAVVHSVAVKPATVVSINDFIAGTCAEHPSLIGFMAHHQDFEDPEAEIDRAMAKGLCGIKMHPDFQKVNLDDPRIMKICEIAERKHLPIIFHTGDYRTDFSHPRRLVNVLHEFPNLMVDAAHFGGWSVYDMALEYLEHENCMMDLSSSMSFLGPRRTRELIEIYGADRIMFGADFPMWDPKSELDLVKALGLSASDYEKVTWHNAERFLGREIS